MPAIFVAEGKADEQILDRLQAGGRQIGGAAIAHALQRRERAGQGRGAAHCTTMARPGSTRISRIAAGSANGSSRPMPSGFSWLRE